MMIRRVAVKCWAAGAARRFASAASTPASSMRDESPEEKFSLKGTVLDGRSIYLDSQATTPVDPRVLDAMMPYQVDRFGNPGSSNHMYGWETEEAVERARRQVAELIGAMPEEILFTSGATESNNIILKGVARFYQERKNHVLTTETEHKCVLDSCRWLEQHGFDVTYLPVGADGLVDEGAFKAALRPTTAIASVMHVHNEIGVVQDIGALGAICREAKVLFHTDAAQGVGKLPIDVKAMKVDAMSISGHKVYGPMGVGAMYLGRRPRVRLLPMTSGGGQERGLRSGTLPTPLIVGMGEACRIAGREMEADRAHIEKLAKRLREGIMSRVPEVYLNGSLESRYPGNLNMSFAAVEGESLLMGIKEVAVSSGSACTSESLEPSYVLRAIKVSEDLAHTSLRFGIGRFTTVEDVDKCVEATVETVAKLRGISAMWDGINNRSRDMSEVEWVGGGV